MPGTYPILVQTLILQVSGQLNDQEGNPTLVYPAPITAFIRWSYQELIGYLNDALLELAVYRPDQFTITQDVLIDATLGGSQQSLPSGYRLLVSINSNGLTTVSGVTADCVGAPVTQCDLNLMRTFYKAPCLPTGGVGDYRVLSYAYDAKIPLVYYVSPSVPVGTRSVVNMTAVIDPPTYIATDYTNSTTTLPTTVDVKFYNFINFFMLGKAYEVDTESSTSQAESEKFYKKAYNTLGISYKMGSDYNRGRYLGEGGSGQMSKERVL